VEQASFPRTFAAIFRARGDCLSPHLLSSESGCFHVPVTLVLSRVISHCLLSLLSCYKFSKAQILSWHSALPKTCEHWLSVLLGVFIAWLEHFPLNPKPSAALRSCEPLVYAVSSHSFPELGSLQVLWWESSWDSYTWVSWLGGSN
jgi:hypothetical protein